MASRVCSRSRLPCSMTHSAKRSLACSKSSVPSDARRVCRVAVSYHVRHQAALFGRREGQKPPILNSCPEGLRGKAAPHSLAGIRPGRRPCRRAALRPSRSGCGPAAAAGAWCRAKCGAAWRSRLRYAAAGRVRLGVRAAPRRCSRPGGTRFGRNNPAGNTGSHDLTSHHGAEPCRRRSLASWAFGALYPGCSVSRWGWLRFRLSPPLVSFRAPLLPGGGAFSLRRAPGRGNSTPPI